MPKVFFYHNAENKLITVCQLLRKAAAQGKAVTVFCGSQNALDSLDRLLWTYDPISFVPHCRVGDPLAANTPILLTTSPTALHGAARLLYLGTEQPPVLEGVEALIEVVGQDDEDRIPARSRFRAYKELGYSIQSIDLSQSKATE